MIKTIDLFAGCGGLMDGFEQSGKYRTLACVEWEKAPCNNLAKRLKDKWKYKNNWFRAELYCENCSIKYRGMVSFRQTYDKVVTKKRILPLVKHDEETLNVQL